MTHNDMDLKYRASRIKLVAFDVDGVMTDGSLTFDEDGREYKTYNAKDGQGVVMLNRAGYITAFITARDNKTVEHRAKILGISRLFQGQKNKCHALDSLLEEYSLSLDEVAYMGDDLPDICILEKAGLACCPGDAVDEVIEICHFVSSKSGGRGAVREFCNFLLKNGKTQ